jgi:hypothetical protein
MFDGDRSNSAMLTQPKGKLAHAFPRNGRARLAFLNSDLTAFYVTKEATDADHIIARDPSVSPTAGASATVSGKQFHEVFADALS